MRRILVITAEAEGAGGPEDVTGFLVEIGVLGALTLALAISIHLLRPPSAGRRVGPAAPGRRAGPRRAAAYHHAG